MARGKKTDAKQIEMEERRQQVYVLRRNGASFRDIARQLNCDAKTAHSDFQEVMRRVIEDNNGTAQEYRELDLARIDRLLQSLAPLVYPPTKSGEPAKPPSLLAVDRYLRALQHRANLLGLNAPQKSDNTLRIIDESAVIADMRRRVEAGELTREELLYATDNNTSLADEFFRGAANRVSTGKDTSL